MDDGLHLRIGFQPLESGDQTLQNFALLTRLDFEINFLLFVFLVLGIVLFVVLF
jgi:hypothetical protein